MGHIMYIVGVVTACLAEDLGGPLLGEDYRRFFKVRLSLLDSRGSWFL